MNEQQQTSKPVVPVRGPAYVSYDENHKVFWFQGIIGAGHPRLGEGVAISSSIIVKITNGTEDELPTIETLNTVYKPDSIEFNPYLKETLTLAKRLTKSKSGSVTLKTL